MTLDLRTGDRNGLPRLQAGAGVPVVSTVLGALLCCLLAGWLEWVGRLPAAVIVQLALALALCLLGSVEVLGSHRAVLTPLAGIATAKVGLLAMPLPLLTPAERLGAQGAFLLLVAALVRRAAFPGPIALWRLHAVVRRWRRLGTVGLEGVALTALAAGGGLVLGVAAASCLPYHAVTRASGAGLIAEVVVVVVTWVVAEESLFRGSLGPQLAGIFGGWSAPIGGAFYVAAYGAARSWVLLLLVGVAGALASEIRRRSGSLWLPGVAHAIAVSTAILLLPSVA